MKRHFRRAAESELGAGVAYIEIVDEWPQRQVEIYGDVWRWGDEGHRENLADQPMANLELRDEDIIAPEEFEQVWTEALIRCPPSS